MLAFESNMLSDVVQQDGLLVAARGLCAEDVLVNLIATYSDEGNLVFIIGTSQNEEEYILSQLKKKKMPITHPKCVTSDCPVNSRPNLYLNGGCFFITSRILVVDFLMERVPFDLITGIIIWRAERILESCQEAFILRLYRMKNKTGFIKAISTNPLSFTMGFRHVERVMKNLFVKKLYLWPRFRAEVSECLAKCMPEVIELHLEMTGHMKDIQVAVLDLITSTLQELKVSNRAISADEFCTENAISPSFEKMLKIQLDPVWHQLSVRSKQLVADLKVLRTILVFLTQYDAVSFYNLISSLMTVEKAMESAGWMLLPSAEAIVHHAKMRVFQDADFASPKKNTQGKPIDANRKFEIPKPEGNPKWSALSEVLNEIGELSGKKENFSCLVVAQDDRTANQLKEYMQEGGEKILKRNFYESFGAKYGLTMPAMLKKKAVNSSEAENTFHLDVGTKKSNKRKIDDCKDGKITLTQIKSKYPRDDNPEDCDNKSSSHNKIKLSVHSLKNQNDPFKLKKLLEDLNPDAIVMYDIDLYFVRLVEVWQARNLSDRRRVYFLIYKGTVEEQIYLTSIKREKDAFEFLINEKTTMLIPEYAEGRSDDNPELRRDMGQDVNNTNQLTRKGGAELEEPPQNPRVIVDMREFRSELPAILHKRGIDIDPATIEVGDYILTPEICVERKSISDLIGSLNSGRLYNQAVSMARYYKRPVLLIEFDHNKAFHLPKETYTKLQLLTLHFPRLCLVWSPSPYATAETFHMLKSEKPEPSVNEAQAVNSDENADMSSDKFNPLIKDFVSKLPGITSKNVFKVLRNVDDLQHLFKMSVDELETIFENRKTAQTLHDALHTKIVHSTKPKEPKHKSRVKFGKIRNKKT